MPTLTTAQRAAFAQRRIMLRNFLWVEARDADTGDPDPVGLWNDVGNVTTGGKTYVGAGLYGSVELATGEPFTVPSMTLSMSGVSADAVALVRGSAISQAPVTLRLGVFDADTRELIGDLLDPPLFRGWIDDVDLPTPAIGETSTIRFTCESLSRALTIRSTDVRSNESQHKRDADDDFYKYADEQRETKIYFGRRAPRGKRGGNRRPGKFDPNDLPGFT